MDEMMNNAEMEKLYAESFQRISPGTMLKGKVILIRAEGIVVNIGYKSEGFIKKEEFTDDEISRMKPGDILEVYVEQMRDSEGMVRLSKERVTRMRSWDTLEKALQENSIVEGKIIEKTKGGMTVDIGGVRAFLPASQIDIRIIKDLDSLIGKIMPFRILKINSRRSNIIVSRRVLLEEERSQKKGETLGRISEGALIKGTVKNITDYGVFVDLGGLDGLLHISDMSWGRLSHPSELFAVGDEIEVKIMKYDPEKEKVTLGYKQKNPDPWENLGAKYQSGSRVHGRVVSVTDYGVFVEIESGLEGLVHISEIDWAPRPKHPSKYLSVGDMVDAVVLKVDQAERKISLSIKQTKSSPWQLVKENYQVGQKISGKVRSITDFGAFVGLPEGIDGLIHISDMSWTRHIKHPSEILKKGQKVDAVILTVDSDREKIALGLKQLEPDPWTETIPSSFRLGDEIEGKVLKNTEFGIFVELEHGVEGLIYSSEIVRPSEPDTIKEGDMIKTRIIKIDVEERKIGLSMKNVGAAEQQ